MALIRWTSLALLGALAAATPLAAQSPGTGATPGRAPTTAPSTTAPSTSAKLIDINSASSSELDALPGIGPARAAAIIKGRPYKGKDELVRRKILPQSVYDAIKDRIVARQA